MVEWFIVLRAVPSDASARPETGRPAGRFYGERTRIINGAITKGVRTREHKTQLYSPTDGWLVARRVFRVRRRRRVIFKYALPRSV